MFHFSRRNYFFECIGLATLLLQLFVFVFGLKPFQAGIWLQTEPTMLALFYLAALQALWLCIGIVYGLLARQPVHLLWLVMLGWVGWQWLITPIAQSSWKMWFGPIEMGEGAAWYTMLLLSTAVAYPFWQDAKCRRALLVAAVCAVLMQCFFHWLTPGDVEEWTEWRPARWPDYLAFMAAYIWIAFYAGGYAKKAGWLCGLIIVMYITLYLSENMAATLLLALAMLATTLLSYPRYPAFLQRLTNVTLHWRRAAIVICFLPVLWIGYSAGMVNFSFEDNEHMQAGFSDKGGSLGARIVLNHIGVAAMKHEPYRWIAGSGWGRFTDDTYKYALADGTTYAFENGILRPNSGQINGSAFHSHCEPLEILLALGLPGLILWFAFPLIVLWRLPKELFWGIAPMLVALVVLSYLWFQLPQVVAFQALAWCALCTVLPATRQLKPLGTRMAAGGLLALAVIMAWSAVEQREASRYGDILYNFMYAELIIPFDPAYLKTDLRRGGSRLRVSAENFTLRAWDSTFKDKSGNDYREWYGHFLDSTEAMARDERAGERNQMTNLWLQYKLLLDFTDDSYGMLRTRATKGIEESILQLTRLAPLREDLAAAFLKGLPDYTHNNIGQQVEILVKILTIAPEHRGAMWLLGKIYLTHPEYKEEGSRMLKRAVELGVERVYPVTVEEANPWR